MTLIQVSLIFTIFLLNVTLFYSSSTSAQLSPPSSPPATAPASGMNTVPLVPASPTGAPTPTISKPKPPSIDIIQILKKAKRFSVLIRLLKTTQLINQLNSQLVTSSSTGLTIFAPEDNSFSKLKAGFLNSLNDRQKVELLQFHTLSSFISISNFDTLSNPVQTQAGDDPKRLQLNVTTDGVSHVSMTTGAVNATVTGTVYADNNKLAIYQVDKVLLPLDLVLPKATLAPAPSPKSDHDDKTTSSSSTSSDDDESNNNKKAGNNNNGDIVEASSVSLSFGVELMIVFGVSFLSAAMMI